jgi:hypothetical protein
MTGILSGDKISKKLILKSYYSKFEKVFNNI